MTYQMWIWLAVAVIYVGFRLLRAATGKRGANGSNSPRMGTARMNAAAQRILQAQGKPQSSSISSGTGQPGMSNTGKQKYRQPHTVRKPGIPTLARPSAVTRLSTPNTGPAIQRRR